MIQKLCRVDDALRGELDALIKAAAISDGFTADVDTDASVNAFKEMSCAIICRKDGQLAGFLFVFAPTPDEVEINALVHPAYRRQGIFHMLLADASEECEKFGYHRGLLLCNERSVDGLAVISRRNLPQQRVEYLMRYEVSDTARAVHAGMSLVGVMAEDINEVAPLMGEVFGFDEERERHYLVKNIDSPVRKQWMLKKDGQILGFCGVCLEERQYYLFGLGIVPSERRKGYARSMLDLVVNDAIEQHVDVLKLDVDSDNPNAISLYKSFGFSNQSAIRYYEFQF